MRFSIGAAAGLVLASAASAMGAQAPAGGASPAATAGKAAAERPAGAGGVAAPVRPTTVALPLSDAQCTGLGGKIRPVVKRCASKKVCVTTDHEGVVRTACITAQ